MYPKLRQVSLPGSSGRAAVGAGGVIGGTPDPMRLPVATDQALDVPAYTALNVPNMTPGQTYLDPVTGITIVKLTTATSPISGTATQMCGVDYATGGCRVGRPIGGVYPIVVMRSPNGIEDYHIITFNINTNAVGYRCAVPAGNREIARAMSLVSTGILYALDGGSPNKLRKYDVSGGSANEIISGVWPKDFSANLHGQTRFVWLQGTVDDRWFTMMPGEAGQWTVSWDTQTDTIYEHDWGGTFNEPKLSKDSPFIHSTGEAKVLDIVSGVEHAISGSSGMYLSHNDCLRQYTFGSDVNGVTIGIWYADTESSSPAIVAPDQTYYIANLYSSGAWVDQASDATQWALLGYQTGNAQFANEKIQRGGLGMTRLNASGGLRLLCHTYNLGDVNGIPDYYTNSIWPNMSPDGRFCLFKSNMNNLGGFSSLFAAILPTS